MTERQAIGMQLDSEQTAFHAYFAPDDFQRFVNISNSEGETEAYLWAVVACLGAVLDSSQKKELHLFEAYSWMAVAAVDQGIDLGTVEQVLVRVLKAMHEEPDAFLADRG